jgi:uncharacterized small protein (DUF1192 family)
MWIILVWGWLKKWWKWVLATLAVVGAFLLGLFVKSKRGGGEVEPTDKKVEDMEARTAARVDEIHRVAAEREKEVAARAEEERAEATADVVADTNIIKDDLNKTNDYLKGVGEEMRKP